MEGQTVSFPNGAFLSLSEICRSAPTPQKCGCHRFIPLKLQPRSSDCHLGKLLKGHFSGRLLSRTSVILRCQAWEEGGGDSKRKSSGKKSAKKLFSSGSNSCRWSLISALGGGFGAVKRDGRSRDTDIAPGKSVGGTTIVADRKVDFEGVASRHRRDAQLDVSAGQYLHAENSEELVGGGTRERERELHRKSSKKHADEQYARGVNLSPGEETNSFDGVWKSGESEKIITRHGVLIVPRSELQKIDELRFCGDLRYGDSGRQVLNLQRALFWLGYLQEPSLTGYFGPETLEAVQMFHLDHGVSDPGFWGALSQQALRKHLFSKPTEHVEAHDNGVDSLGSTVPVPNNRRGGSLQNEVQALQTLERWCTQKIRDYNINSGNLLLGFVLIAGVVKLKSMLFRRPLGQPVRRRVMSWRNEAHGNHPGRKVVRTPLQDLPWSSDQGNERHLPRSKQMDNREDSGNLLDRLVLFDGEVIRGDTSTIGSGLSMTNSELKTPLEDSKSRTRSYPQPGLGDRYEHRVQDVNPGRQFSPLSAVHHSYPSENAADGQHKKFGTGREDLHIDGEMRFYSSIPGWPRWVSHIVAMFFPVKEKQAPSVDRFQKRPFRRSVMLNNSYRQAKTMGRGASGRGVSLRNGSTRGAHWQEQDELNLKNRLEELHRKVQTVEQTRQAAMRALAEEKMRSIELEVKISRQKEAAVALEEEVRVLKESHNALLTTLRKKYSSSAAARAAAALLYQNWDSNVERTVERSANVS